MLKLGPSPSFKNIIPSQFSLCKQFFSTSWPPSSGNFFRINYNNYFLATVINLICASTVLNCTTIGSVYLQYKKDNFSLLSWQSWKLAFTFEKYISVTNKPLPKAFMFNLSSSNLQHFDNTTFGQHNSNLQPMNFCKRLK